MAHLDVFKNPNAAKAPGFPYLLEVQTALLGDMPTTVVIPLGLPSVIDHIPVLRLNPTVAVAGRRLLVMTQELAAIKRRSLKAPVANLSANRDDILSALDFLFSGF
jgi:toxin CcdB